MTRAQRLTITACLLLAFVVGYALPVWLPWSWVALP